MNPIDTLDHIPPATPTSPQDRSDHPAAPPPESPATRGDERPWPGRDRVLVIGLAVLALLGLVGTIVGFATSSSDDDASAELQAIEEQLEQARSERDAAVGDVDALEGRISILEARLGAVEAERDQLADELSTAGDDTAAMRARIAELDTTITGVRAEIAAAVSDRDAALADVEDLEAELATARQQAAQAIAERNALAGRFPLTVDPAIDVADAVGQYRVSWQEQYCSGTPSCGTAPKVTSATVRSTPEGYLRIELGNLVTTNLSRVTGGLHAVTASTTALSACDGAARAAAVTLTLYPDSWTVAKDGAVEVRTWGGAVTVQAPATGSCPAALAFYGVALTPAA